MQENTKILITLTVLTVVFGTLAVGFTISQSTRSQPDQEVFLVDEKFLDNSPVRDNYTARVEAGEDVSDYDCYICHDQGDPVELKFDDQGQLIINEHSYNTFKHGPTHENSYCFNCHDPKQMDHLRTQYGKSLTFDQSSELCGSCHGTTYRDWQANAHGRNSGYWNLEKGERTTLDCTQCHDPHDTRFPSIEPAPGPNFADDRDVVQSDSSEHEHE